MSHATEGYKPASMNRPAEDVEAQAIVSLRPTIVLKADSRLVSLQGCGRAAMGSEEEAGRAKVFVGECSSAWISATRTGRPTAY